MAATKLNNVSAPAATGEMGAYAQLFRALGDPIRTEIVRRAALMDELPCTQLEKALSVSKSTISYHIKVLFHAGLLEIRKEGRFYFYRLREDLLATHLSEFLDRLRETSLHEPDAVPEGSRAQRRRDELAPTRAARSRRRDARNRDQLGERALDRRLLHADDPRARVGAPPDASRRPDRPRRPGG